MLTKIATLLAFAGAAVSTSVTPHDVYGSSIGVLGCHVNTNRIAYFPSSPGCNNLCKKVTANGRSVHLLHVDQSGGAYDISYDAWNYLNVGEGAKTEPTTGGGIAATISDAPMSECANLIYTPNKKLPLSASNSMGTYAGCPVGSYIRDNAALYNILNPNACTYGYNEVCSLDLAVSNQPKCAHILGANNALSGLPVINLAYSTGKEDIAKQ